MLDAAQAGPDADALRKAAVLRCAGCHQSQHENPWPHARSCEKLRAHIEAVQAPDSSAPPSMKANLQKPSVTRECVNCHAPSGSVFEGFLAAEWDEGGALAFKVMENPEGAPRLTGGVDCLTCHRQGRRVVTRAEYKPSKSFKPPKGFCDPLPSKAFSHINSCAGCHEGQARAYADKFAREPSKRVRPFVACNDCHMEHDAAGKPTHYYAWKAGVRGGEHIPKSGFDKIALDVKAVEGQRRLELKWRLDFTPHPFVPNSYKLYTFLLEVFDGKDAPAYAARFGLMALTNPGEPEEAKEILGRQGLDLVVHNTLSDLERSFVLPQGVGSSGRIRLTVGKRPRYWEPEAAEARLYRREIEFQP